MLKIAKPKNDREKNMESFLPTSEIAKNRRERSLPQSPTKGFLEEVLRGIKAVDSFSNC
jgi:hypothetical protein